ncbi:MAG: YfiR family protein [Acidobacteriota bacterium]|nr:YfiR family protein [Acidobacteriota bacterium]
MAPVTQRRSRSPWPPCLVLALFGVCPLAAQAGSEYELKAAFLYKFASFVEWPREASNPPLCICVLGQDPFGPVLDRIVSGKRVNGRPFTVRRLRPGDPAQGCHILFIAASERRRLKEILDSRQGEPVLTVSDIPGFCETGGGINLALQDNRVRLEINPIAVERAGLQASSRLLALARLVRPNEAAPR